MTTSGTTSLIYEHDWAFLEGKKTHSRTLKAGHHRFPFQLDVGGHLPCSISTTAFGGANVSYKLRAVVHRPGFSQNLHAQLPITIVRSFAPDSLEYQQSSEIENTWPGKLMYSTILPHKAWAAGDTITALAKFVPVSKGVKVLSITTTVSETVRISLTKTVVPECTRPVSVSKHEIIGEKPVCRFEFHYRNKLPSLFRREDTSAESPSQTGSSVGGAAEDDEQSDGLIIPLEITLPSFMTPTHEVDPISVIHRIRWNVIISNPDGHTSELRYSLNIHVLDAHVLSEARAASAPTRRLLLGMYGSPEEEGEEVQLPSYNAHVHDRVPITNQQYSVSSETRTPSSGLQSPAGQGQLDMHLPQVPADAPLEWIMSELSRHQLSNNPVRSGESSASSSRFASRLPSRASSPERTSRTIGPSSPPHPHESRGIFRNPFTAIASSFSHSSRNPSHQSVNALSQSKPLDIPEGPRRVKSGPNTTENSPVSSPPAPSNVPSVLNDVPDYETASRGFAGGGVPPLTSVRGLPTYEEASTPATSSAGS